MLNWCNILTWLCLLDLGRITESNSDSTFFRVEFRPKWLIGLLFSKKHFWLGISSRVESHQPVENSPKVELFLRVSTRLFPWIYASLNHFRLGVVCRANQHCCEHFQYNHMNESFTNIVILSIICVEIMPCKSPVVINCILVGAGVARPPPTLPPRPLLAVPAAPPRVHHLTLWSTTTSCWQCCL